MNQPNLPSQKVNHIFSCSPRWLWLAIVFISWGLVLLCLWLAQKCSKAPYKHFLNCHQTIYAFIQFRDLKSFLIPDYRNQMSRLFWNWSLEVKVLFIVSALFRFPNSGTPMIQAHPGTPIIYILISAILDYPKPAHERQYCLLLANSIQFTYVHITHHQSFRHLEAMEFVWLMGSSSFSIQRYCVARWTATSYKPWQSFDGKFILYNAVCVLLSIFSVYQAYQMLMGYGCQA